MKKIISTLTAVIMICALSAFGFAACLGNESDDRELSSQWSANWDAYRPNLNNPMPSEPPDGDNEEPEGGNSNSGAEDIPQVIVPAIKYSSMIKAIRKDSISVPLRRLRRLSWAVWTKGICCDTREPLTVGIKPCINNA